MDSMETPMTYQLDQMTSSEIENALYELYEIAETMPCDWAERWIAIARRYARSASAMERQIAEIEARCEARAALGGAL